jgi:hypothetical protein
MTIIVLDEHADHLDRYASWLTDGEPLIAISAVTSAGRRQVHPGFAEVQEIAGYAPSAALELAVVHAARLTQVSGIVAAGFPDLLRAAALREFLGIRGQRKPGALASVDLVAQRDLLAGSGVPVAAARPVSRPAELCWQAHQIGYPIQVRRRRRAAGWPKIAMLDSETALLRFLRNQLHWRGLVVEPANSGEPIRISLIPDAEITMSSGSGVSASDAVTCTQIANDVAAALLDWPRLPLLIDVLCGPDGRVLVDSVSVAFDDDPALLRAFVRDQAGLPEMAAVS